MAHNPAHELASAIQSAHIKHDPSPIHDTHPSSSILPRDAVHVRRDQVEGASAHHQNRIHIHHHDGEFPLSLLDGEPVPRKPNNLPPLPDLRFEQSYLARIKPYQDKQQWGWVAWVTIVDQVLLPLTQGIAWNLAIFGWRRWNTATKFSGQSVGARIRRWWWSVNNWEPPLSRGGKKEL